MSDQHIISGTVYLVDVQHALNSPHAGNGDIILVSTPTDDPDDPLNWSRRRKLLSVTCMSVYMLMIALSCSLMYSIVVPVSEETGLSVADLNAGTGYNYLAFGWGCLLWQPAAQVFGKRPIYLISLLMSLAVTVAVPYALSPGAWMAMKILSGLVGSPLECLGEISIADVFFAHERVLGAIWLAIGFVFCFFLMEETNYTRPSVLANQVTQQEVMMNDSKIDEEQHGTSKKGDAIPRATHADVSSGSVTKSRKTILSKLKVFDQVRPTSHVWTMVFRPLQLFSYPVIVYSGFSYGCSLIWYAVLNGTASVVLSSPPHNFSASYVGLAYISPMIGAGIGSLIAGNLGDLIVIRLARRSNGVWHSEYRQWLNVVMAVLLPGSLLLWGLGASHHIHWFGLVFAMGVIGCCISMGATLSLSYCIDTYTDFGADAVVSTMCIRNTMGFAIGYAITPWTENLGYQNAFLIAAGAGLLQVLTFLIMIKWGPAIRKSSAERYGRDVERVVALGISH